MRVFQKLILVAVLLNLLPGSTSGQTCLPAGIVFTSQAEIDAFPTNYPGCTQIQGGMTISGAGTVTNLNGLSGVTSIGGNVILNALGSLTSLSGLSSLTSIGGYLRITECDLLTNLSGLQNLTSIGGDYLWIGGNDALTSLTALSSLTSLSTQPGGSFLEIDNNDQLASLNGLQHIAHTTIGVLYLTNSSNLSICDVASICNFVNAGGTSTISANATGCNTLAQVQASCVPVCGDGSVEGMEGCDDGNTNNGDGCSSFCLVEPGWICASSPSVCTEVCGNGIITPSEGCDDGNTNNGDGCNSSCQVESGWACCGQPSACNPISSSYTFSGSGSWCDAARWGGAGVPPSCLASGTTITINGTCEMNCGVNLYLYTGVTLTVSNTGNLSTWSNDVLAVNGGSLINHGIIVVRNGSSGTGYISVLSGTFTNNHNMVVHSGSYFSVGGTFQNNNLLYNEGGNVTFQPGSMISCHTISNLAGSITNFSGDFDITNSCTNSSSGTITNANYGGPPSNITIQAGATFTNQATATLNNSSQIENCGTFNNAGTVNSYGTFTNCPSSIVNINAGGSISCTNEITGGTVYNAGDVFPGCSPGIMTVDGAYTNDASGELNIEIGGLQPGTDYDQLIVTGAATLAGTLTVTLINGFNPAVNNEFTIMTFGSRTGTFSTVNIPCFSCWQITYSATQLKLVLLSPLPVELVSFNAKVENRSVQLDWRTASETNSRGFEIQRSTDARNWAATGWVDSHPEAATGGVYSFTDVPPSSVIFYYRLKQVDWDGKAEFSPVRQVQVGDERLQFHILPNPNDGSFTLAVDVADGTGFDVTLCDLNGKMLWEHGGTGTGTPLMIKPGVAGLKPGVFFVKLRTAGSSTVKRLAVQY